MKAVAAADTGYEAGKCSDTGDTGTVPDLAVWRESIPPAVL